VITAGGIASGREMGFHLPERAGHDAAFVRDVARMMECEMATDLYRDDREIVGADAA
jgi:hypothetical protein